MTAVWLAIGGVALINFAIKATGPVIFGGRTLPPVLERVLSLLAPAMLAALVVVETFARGQAVVLDARVVGLAAAAVALLVRAPVVVVIIVAPAADAAARAAGLT
jgi:branched-subunit amino acid transport protein